MAVAQMDQAVQQNASLVEEATAATESMKEQAGTLLQSVSRFKLGGAQATAYTDVHHSEPRAASHAGHASQQRPARAWAERPAHLRGAAVTALGAPQPQKQASADWQEF
jgi:methyl-accepting chemotaxis protein